MAPNPCTDILTNFEYLQHMIPHHVVAIDMSELLMKETTNPYMLHISRNIIKKQKYEIWEMEMVKNSLHSPLFSSIKGNIDRNVTSMSYYEPLQSTSTGKCDPNFFNPDEHAKHMFHKQITDENYLQHMIPHHQVAVDMSKRLLLHTNHSYLLDFCRKLIVDQQGEITLMNNLLNSTLDYKSDIL
jgi:uncharacterized protein (DUF305 family)